MKFRLNLFYLYLLCSLLAVALVASGCGDDEPNVEEPSNALIGTWSLSTLIATNCAEVTDNGSEIRPCTADECLKWEFREGGVIIISDTFDGDTDVSSGTYVISGNDLTISADGDTNTGVFSVVGNTFGYNLRDQEFECDIEAQFSLDN